MNVKTPIEVPDGTWKGHLIRRARKAHTCDYWKGTLAEGKRCKSEITSGDLYLEGDANPESFWSQERYCRNCVADVFDALGLIDTSDIPPLTEEFFGKAALRMPEGKEVT